ncbi:hypothetical protein GWI33_010631 [Rhynchophorus ferrugineus]|uniref:Uncharacterized protein n=1 Tax=Rhynchophorus ferrugineus TaxID=354439 RepID=A0A834IQI1_RHYFE|nr:hypothetical protein GWI33_010631 [Rhynchophorus ferrugineus]
MIYHQNLYLIKPTNCTIPDHNNLEDNINDTSILNLVKEKNLSLSSVEGTESTSLQRNNTFTTYVTLNRKNRLSTYQAAARSASLMKGGNTNGTSYVKRTRTSNEMADEPI